MYSLATVKCRVLTILHQTQPFDIPETIRTKEDAQQLFDSIEAEWRSCTETLKVASAQYYNVLMHIQDAESKLDQVDRRVGRLRLVIKRCGFEEVLRPVTRRPALEITQLQGMAQSPSVGLVSLNSMSILFCRSLQH